MATFSRHADVEWTGSIMEGKGQVKAGTGAFTLPVTFPARIGEPGGYTSPEELVASAHAACFAMALNASRQRRVRNQADHVEADGRGGGAPGDREGRLRGRRQAG
jgi:organic hydroperoxide reductase OsmC/OhrA